ncbi:helix-turn-helix domain-containing protein [Paracoccus fistulariae]|uniref:DUF4115 domain-containing protein n=1 Tax=Paracoccus fistulariae TaxID=658446 RepID=A0ABY7SMR4_9RHOB|nr:helix-turn-helix domain-containing protein [Paracoccus fistulariae]MDB6180208.1 helix-turn-helix domain-containing protein [Paracoccus fistulariae]WCR08293.1 DUF4115 domain-containing protein [Paracoccus fistulariae]
MSRLRADYPAEEIVQVEEVEHFLDDETRLGDIMRGERATMGKSLLDVQRELRIRASYVAAIENCDITAFDAPSFIAGYVRSYARYLGMDSDWTFRRFCVESGFQPTHGMAPSASGPKPVRRPSDPAEALANPHALFLPQRESFWSSIEPRAIGAILVLVLLVGGLGYGGWTVLQEVQRVTLSPGEDSPEVATALDPTEAAGMAGPALDTSDSSEIAQTLPQRESLDRLYRPQILEAPVLISRDGPIASIDPGLSVALAGPETVTDVAGNPGLSDSVQAAIQTALNNSNGSGPMDYGPQQPIQTAMTVAADAPPLELLAARPAWVRVTASDGTVLLEKIMDAGERFTLPNLEQAPLLRTGNSGAVYFAVNGRTYGPAAPGPQVVKNVELSQDNLTATYTLADLNADPELAQMVAMAQAPVGMTDGPVTE